MNDAILRSLQDLYRATFGESPTSHEWLPAAASDRRYVRLRSAQNTALGAYNPRTEENDTFIYFAEHLRAKGVRVPQVYAHDPAAHVYLLQDLGDTTLLQALQAARTPTDPFPAALRDRYAQVVRDLAHLQVHGHDGLDYARCTERPTFDAQAMRYDLNAFRFHFLKFTTVSYRDEALEADFEALIAYLTAAEVPQRFMFRDFQSRNIMLHADAPYYIDFQSARLGPMPYDLASLLYQAKADLPQADREYLTTLYIEAVQAHLPIDAAAFRRIFYGFVLLRTLQVLSTYGFRGWYQGKAHFRQSIPYALDNLQWLLAEADLPLALPTLRDLARQLLALPQLSHTHLDPDSTPAPLTVRVTSFSYKRGGIPTDPTGHGGGFVFDCRSLHNPGRYAPYKTLTGRDQPVKTFLENESEMPQFLDTVKQLIAPAVRKYIARGFDHLMVSFGCTGGQHRSVYAADAIADYLRTHFNIAVTVEHIEQEKKNWINTLDH